MKKEESAALRKKFFKAIAEGNIVDHKAAINAGQSVNALDENTLLPALHLAVGNDQLGSTQCLVANGATFKADRFGRWPSVIAVEVGADDELIAFVCEAEAKLLEPAPF